MPAAGRGSEKATNRGVRAGSPFAQVRGHHCPPRPFMASQDIPPRNAGPCRSPPARAASPAHLAGGESVQEPSGFIGTEGCGVLPEIAQKWGESVAAQLWPGCLGLFRRTTDWYSQPGGNL